MFFNSTISIAVSQIITSFPMLSQHSMLFKAQTTPFTVIKVLIVHLLHVSLEDNFLCKSFFANCANVSFDTFVSEIVIIEGSFGFEEKMTNIALELSWIIAMNQ